MKQALKDVRLVIRAVALIGGIVGCCVHGNVR
jgi:hypothetical protein